MTDIVKIDPKEFQLDEVKASELTQGLSVTLGERKLLIEQFMEVSEMDVTKTKPKVFKELRLKIAKNRNQGIGKWHKANKEVFLRGGQFIDAINRREVAVNQEMEAKLLEGEKYFELQEKKRKEELQVKRLEEIAPYLEDLDGRDFASMPDDAWEAYLETKIREFATRIEAEKAAEEERREKERIEGVHYERSMYLSGEDLFRFGDFEDKHLGEVPNDEWNELLRGANAEKEKYKLNQEAIRKDNERLQKEAEEREKAEAIRIEAEQKERERIEAEHQAKLQAEREERERVESEERAKRERVEAELRKKQAEELKAKEDEAAREQHELNKGDAEKVKDLVSDLEALKTKYTFKSAKNKKMYSDVGVLMDKVINHINL